MPWTVASREVRSFPGSSESPLEASPSAILIVPPRFGSAPPAPACVFFPPHAVRRDPRPDAATRPAADLSRCARSNPRSTVPTSDSSCALGAYPSSRATLPSSPRSGRDDSPVLESDQVPAGAPWAADALLELEVERRQRPSAVSRHFERPLEAEP